MAGAGLHARQLEDLVLKHGNLLLLIVALLEARNHLRCELSVTFLVIQI